jgi:hypothetical protein
MPSIGRVALAACIAASTLVPAAAFATGGEGEAWPAFTESSACGAQRITTPHSPYMGWLNRSFVLRGEYGAYFGRTVQDVFNALVRWPIPGSTEVLAVHPAVVPALDTAAASIQTAYDDGDTYTIDNRTTYSTAARTIGGSIRISRHTYGIAFDFNASRNPHRGDNRLITDMPAFWVDSFLDAGFCWGGLWVGSKDAMHYAWQGPAFSGYDEIPLPLPPLTERQAFGGPDVLVPVVPRPLNGTFETLLADVDGNGAADVVRIVRTGGDVMIDTSVASRRHNACSARRSIVPSLGQEASDAHTLGFGDWDGRGGNDLWLVTDDDGSLRLVVRWAFGGYTAETAARTEVPTPSDDAWVTTGDFDVDGALDLFIVDDGTVSVWAIDPMTGDSTQLLSTPDPFPGADTYFLGDVDLDNRPDLWALSGSTVSIATAASDYGSIDDTQQVTGIPASVIDVVASDYDGDGRPDLVTFDGFTKRVWLGNTPLPDDLPHEVWFEFEEPECAENEATWNRDELRFSASTWSASGSYEWRSLHGLSVGCDPSEESCVPEPTTRRTFAEYIAWIDGLPPASTDPDIAAPRAAAIAGYRLPCALDDEECWDGPMSRAESSLFYGRFLADRHGNAPEPHRWVSVVPYPVETLLPD